MKKTIRILMWIHFVYLLCLPTLAVVSAVVLFPREDYWTQLLIIGFPAVVTYCLFLASGYSIPESFPVALALVMAVPLQVAAAVYLFGGGSIWLFLAENAAVEISAFVIGMMTVALPRLRSGSSSFLIVLIAVPCFIGGSLPHIALVFYGYGEASLWLLLFITAFLTAFADHIQSCKKATAAYDKTQRVQNLDMRYEGGPLFKLLRIDPRVPAISPLWNDENKTKLNPRVHVFAWIAIFLPVVVGTIAGVVTVP